MCALQTSLHWRCDCILGNLPREFNLKDMFLVSCPRINLNNKYLTHQFKETPIPPPTCHRTGSNYVRYFCDMTLVPHYYLISE